MANKNGPGTPIGLALEMRERARKQMAGVSTPGNPRGPVAKAEPTMPAPVAAPKGNSRGDRNNNPGNLEASPWTRKQPGFVRSDGRFAIFDTPENGIRAQETLLRSNYFGKGGTTTIDALISRYGNDPGTKDDVSVANYKKYVASKLGIGVGDPVSKDKVRQLAQAMREFETGNRSGGGGSAGGGSVPQINVQASSVQGPSGQVNTGVNQQNNRIMNSSGKIESQQREGEARAENATNILDNYMQVLGQTQAEQMQTTAKFAESARAVNTQMMEATAELQQRVKPIFETRQRVLDQMAAIQDMDPISRAVRGFFDLNYNQEYLMGTSAKLGAIVKEQGDIYSVMQGLHGDSLEALDRLHSIDSMLPKMREAQASEMVKGSMMQVQRAMDNLGITMEGVQNEASIIQSQNMARRDLIGRLDGPTTSALLAQAEQGDGNVTYNGVTFSGQELRERGMQIEDYDLAHKNALRADAMGDAELADKNAGRMMTYMTDSQVDEAIANGGEYDGVQIPINALVAEKTNRTKQTLEAVEADKITTSPYQAAQASRAAVQYGQQLEARGASVFGNAAFQDETRQYNLQITDIINKITAESLGGKSPIVLGALSQQLAELKSGYGKAISGKVNRLVGGDETGAGYVTSYLLGDQVTPGAGADMMVHFAMKGGLPAAMQTSEYGQNAMKVVMQTVDQLSTGVVGGKRLSAEQVKVEAARRLADPNSAEGKKLRSATTGLKFQGVFSSLPSLAQANGQVLHKFGEFDRDVFARVSRNADIQGLSEVANQLGVDVNTMRAIRGGKVPPGADPELVKAIQDPSVGKRVSAAQQRYLVDYLDQEAPVSANMSNSELMLDFLQSPVGQQRLIQADDRSRAGGIGDWMAGSVGRGGLLDSFNGYSKGFGEAVGLGQQQNKVESALIARTYRNDVPKRTLAVLSAMPGLTRNEAMQLNGAIKTMLPQGSKDQAATQAARAPMRTEYGWQSSLTKQQLDAVDNIILNHKFDDPALERIRRKAQGQWVESSRAANSWADTLWNLAPNVD